MPRPMSVRMAGLVAALALSIAVRASAQTPVDSSLTRLQAELQRTAPGDTLRGTLGVAMLHLETGRMVSLHGRDRFPMASTVKLPIALTLLRRVDQGTINLDSTLAIQPWDLHPGSGTLNGTHPARGQRISLRDLLSLMLTVSDNSATDMLLRTVGGATPVMDRLKESRLDGITVSRSTIELIADALGIPALPADTLRTLARFDSLARKVSDADQKAAGQRLLKDPRDTATPEGMVRLLEALWTRRVLREETTRQLLGIMYKCETGPNRIKGMLPDSTAVAHKTGTLTMGIANDVGIITLPGTAGHVAIALFLSGSHDDDATKDRALASVARTAFDYFLFTPPTRAAP